MVDEIDPKSVCEITYDVIKHRTSFNISFESHLTGFFTNRLSYTLSISESILIVGPISVEIFFSVETFLNDRFTVDTFDVDRFLERRMGLNLMKPSRV